MAKRTDAAFLAAYVAAKEVPTRRLEAYVLCFHGGFSKSQAAAQMGVTFDAVCRHIRLLRLAARRWAGPTAPASMAS